MATQSDLITAINQVAAERAISKDEILTAIKEAIKESFTEYQDFKDNLKVELDEVTGQISVSVLKTVSKEVKNDLTEISLEESKKLDKTAQIGDVMEIDVTPSKDFGRVAAQAARQSIMKKIRDTERDNQLEEFKDKMGTIENGIVQRMDGDNVLVEIRRLTAIMDQEDRVPGEMYRSGNRIKVLLKEIIDTPKGRFLKVSRSNPDFLKALFILEIPEVESESVVIKGIAREAGSRSKVAVYSNAEGVDPIGACVGQKGIRINSIMNELKFGRYEEKVDIILWDPKIETYISNALSPAQTISVEYDEKEETAYVIVPDEQLSLAIGKEGQNARLAAKLTGKKIDIKGETIEPNSTKSENETVDAVEKEDDQEAMDVATEDQSSDSNSENNEER